MKELLLIKDDKNRVSDRKGSKLYSSTLHRLLLQFKSKLWTKCNVYTSTPLNTHLLMIWTISGYHIRFLLARNNLHASHYTALVVWVDTIMLEWTGEPTMENCTFVVDPVIYEWIYFSLVLYSLFTEPVKYLPDRYYCYFMLCWHDW